MTRRNPIEAETLAVLLLGVGFIAGVLGLAVCAVLGRPQPDLLAEGAFMIAASLGGYIGGRKVEQSIRSRSMAEARAGGAGAEDVLGGPGRTPPPLVHDRPDPAGQAAADWLAAGHVA